MQESASDEKLGNESNAPEIPTREESLRLARWKLLLLMFGNSLAVFCVALDNTVMANVIPKITQTFNSLEDVGWYTSVYFFTNCSVILLFGKLYTHYSMKWIFLVALALFEIGSLICGAAVSSVALIVGRAIAGLGAGGILPGAILIISESVPLPRRPLYTSALGGMSGVAAVVGPLIGGAFTQNLTWRWCFYINLPLGAATTVIILCCVVDSQTGTTVGSMGRWDKFQRLDIPGLLIFIPAVFCLLLPLQWGGVKYPWNSVRIIVLFVIFILAATSWIFIECYMKEQALVPPRLIRECNVWSSALYMACIVGSFIIILYYFPIWFQAVKGGSPLQSGTMILPIIIGLIVCMTLGAVFVTTVGYYHPIMAIGTIISTIGAGLCTTLDVNSSSSKIIGYQAMCGIGLGFGFQLPFIAVQTALPKSDIPVATAIVTFAQNLSEAVLVALGQTIFQNRLLAHIEQSSPSVDPHAIVHGGAANLDQRFPADVLPEIVHAYSDAVTDTFYAATAIAALSVIGLIRLEWLSVKKKGTNENAAEVHL